MAFTARIVPLIVAVLTVSSPFQVEGAEAAETERAAVLAALDSWNRGWAERDAELAVRDYSEDVDWTNAFGDRFQGRSELKKGLEFIFSLDFVMVGDSGDNEFEDVRFLSPDVALLRSKLVRAGQETSAGEVMADRHVHHLRVLQKREGRWLIISHLISQAKDKL